MVVPAQPGASSASSARFTPSPLCAHVPVRGRTPQQQIARSPESTRTVLYDAASTEAAARCSASTRRADWQEVAGRAVGQLQGENSLRWWGPRFAPCSPPGGLHIDATHNT